MPLGFGRCSLRIAVPDAVEWTGPKQLNGQKIATTYPNLLTRYLKTEGIDAEIVAMSGAVEVAPRLKMANAICDLVSTGATSLSEGSPVETRTVEVQPAAVQGLAPVPQQSEAQPSAQQAPEGQPDEPKKGGFWGKLNPFRGKSNAFKKRKEASALRSTDGDSPVGRQE